jgi:uncharacterized damage-inducible protein DinB
MKYSFLVDTYDTERIKVLSVWSEFRDDDMPIRPHEHDARGRSVHEHMVHQCLSEDAWFRRMLGIDVGAPPLPESETRLMFIQRYLADSGKRVIALRATNDAWWEESAPFFDVRRSRAWIVTRRLNHTAHHRGQLMGMLRMLGRDVHSNYGPTADTGGFAHDQAATIYAYADADSLVSGELAGGRKTPLPGTNGRRVTERPGPLSPRRS